MKRVIFLLFVVVLLCGCEDTKKEEVESYSDKNITLTCTYTDKDLIDHKIDLLIEKGVLISKTETLTWVDKDVTTCNFYKERNGIYAELTGIIDRVDCNDNSGTRETTYIINELNDKEVRIKEFQYIRSEDSIFEINSYKNYMNKKGAKCIEVNNQ